MILFEGNIAAGKSTVGRRLAESGLFDFIEEPVGSWQKDFAANLLDLFYKDPKRWSFTFQLAAFTTRAKTWTEVLAMTDHQNVVLERSIYCDRYVFASRTRSSTSGPRPRSATSGSSSEAGRRRRRSRSTTFARSRSSTTSG